MEEKTEEEKQVKGKEEDLVGGREAIQQSNPHIYTYISTPHIHTYISTPHINIYLQIFVYIYLVYQSVYANLINKMSCLFARFMGELSLIRSGLQQQQISVVDDPMD